ncbi:MAG: hypothetical protein L0H26_12335, partial [Microlunatus sp.]|nr:hypothetical protein [Microlunatus sp.]
EGPVAPIADPAAVDQATQEVATAQDATQDVEKKIATSWARYQQAVRDYEATPRGAGELRAEADKADRSGNTTAARALTERLAVAEDRLRQESLAREENAEQRGEKTRFTPVRAMPTTIDDNDRGEAVAVLARLADADGVSGSVRSTHDGPRSAHEVTLSRTDDDGTHHEVRFTYEDHRTGPHSPPPSVGSALSVLTDQSSQHAASHGNFERWAGENGYPRRDEDPEAYEAAKRRYRTAGNQSDSAGKFFGSDRWNHDYVGTETLDV